MVDWRRGVHLPWVYVHSSICETYSVLWYSMDLWLIGGGGAEFIWCSGIPEIYGQLEEGGHLILVCTSSEKNELTLEFIWCSGIS